MIRWTGAIAVDADADAQTLNKAVQAAGEALERGELVALFTERGQTRGGARWTFAELLTGLHNTPPCPSFPSSWISRKAAGSACSTARCYSIGHDFDPMRLRLRSGAPLPADIAPGAVVQAVQHLSARRRDCPQRPLYRRPPLLRPPRLQAPLPHLHRR